MYNVGPFFIYPVALTNMTMIGKAVDILENETVF
jgi:hypothetical protein